MPRGRLLSSLVPVAAPDAGIRGGGAELLFELGGADAVANVDSETVRRRVRESGG